VFLQKNPQNGYRFSEAATEAFKNEIDVLVTAPINKDEMMKYGFAHAGHTGYFEEKAQKKG
jgi:4-hydroxythreonine-4-phosphate dehydrogenase